MLPTSVEQALGVGDEQGSLACCHPRGRKELDTTERLTELITNKVFFFFLFLLIIYNDFLMNEFCSFSCLIIFLLATYKRTFHTIGIRPLSYILFIFLAYWSYDLNLW